MHHQIQLLSINLWRTFGKIRVFKRLLHLILKFLTKNNFFSESLRPIDILCSDTKDSTTISFCNSLDRLAMHEWLPTNQDLLQTQPTRAMSTELSESFFIVGPITWTVIQLSGQRSERRKWIHSLEQVHYVISVVALSNSHKYWSKPRHCMSTTYILSHKLHNASCW